MRYEREREGKREIRIMYITCRVVFMAFVGLVNFNIAVVSDWSLSVFLRVVRGGSELISGATMFYQVKTAT